MRFNVTAWLVVLSPLSALAGKQLARKPNGVQQVDPMSIYQARQANPAIIRARQRLTAKRAVAGLRGRAPGAPIPVCPAYVDSCKLLVP